VLGLVNCDPEDLARRARVTASSAAYKIKIETPMHRHVLTADVGITFPVDPSLVSVELLVDADTATTLTVELAETGKPQNFVPGPRLDVAEVAVTAGTQQWVHLPLAWQPAEARTAFLIVRKNPALALHLESSPQTGILAYERGPKPIVDPALPVEEQPDQPVSEWRLKPFARMTPCLRIAPETKAFAPERAIDGYTRPWNGPHLWCSAPMAKGKEECLELHWDERVPVGRVHLTFNDNPNEYLNNLHYIRVPFTVMPELVRDYRLEALNRSGAWEVLWRERGNRARRRVHTLPNPVATDCLRLVIEATNGAPRAEVIEIRIYSSGSQQVGILRATPMG
jgi:hypothetical protein